MKFIQQPIKSFLKNSWYSLKNVNHNLRQLLLKPIRYFPQTSQFLGLPRKSYEHTKDWVSTVEVSSKAFKAEYKCIYPRHQMTRREPKTRDQNIHWKFQKGYQHQVPESFVAIVSDGRVWGNQKNGAVIAPDDSVLGDVSKEINKPSEQHSIFSQWKLPSPQKLEGMTVILAALRSQGYFHWMLEVLPRLHLLNCSGIKIKDIDWFVIHSCPYPFHRETLEILGIPHKKVIESCKVNSIKAETLIIPSEPGWIGCVPQWASDFIRQEFLIDKILDCSEKSTYIYISRSQASRRRVVNEDDVIKVLNKFGFLTVVLESLSFQKQVSLFAKAQTIIAPHGAGLTNLVFCQPGTKVIELFAPNYVNVCYWALSQNLSLDYYYLLGEHQNLSQTSFEDSMTDITVDLDKLLEIMNLAKIDQYS